MESMKNMEKIDKSSKRNRHYKISLYDNGGASLVEMLIAFAVSAVVLSGIAYMLITSLRVTGKNNAEAEVQSEVQTAMNLLVDEVMEAKGICMKIAPGGGDTDCILFGDMNIIKEGGAYTLYYKGNVFAASAAGAGGSRELYLADFPNEAYTANGDGYCRLASGATQSECALAGLNNAEAYIAGLPEEKRVRWLLGKDISSCVVTPSSEYDEETVKEKGMDVIRTYFQEPFTLKIYLKIERDYGDGTVVREIEDQIAVRNRIDRIYITKKGMPADNIEVYERHGN